MAFNTSVFKTRALTALVFVGVMSAGLFTNGYAFITLFTIVMIGCVYELYKLIIKIEKISDRTFLPLSVLYIIFPVFLLIDLGLNGNTYLHKGADHFSPADYSPLFPCAIIFSIWINDTMAYIVGSLIGKTPLSSVSPKKTWEGTIGGVLLSVVVIGLAGRYLSFAQTLPSIHWFAIASIAAVFGTLGDLFESKLKRLADVKDSGSFMPGHGGFLDRFDSLLIAVPFVWMYIQFIC